MSYTIFTSAPSSANGFAMLAASASPRDAHLMYRELHSALAPRKRGCARRRTSSNVKEGLKRLLGGL